MNRYEPSNSISEVRPPRKRRLWLWIPVISLLALAVIGAILYFPFFAFQKVGFPMPPPASVATATAHFEEWQPQIQAVGSLKALDDRSGKVLWETNVGAPLSGYPITYAVNGRQYLAVSTGPSNTSSITGRLTPELQTAVRNRIIVFALP